MLHPEIILCIEMCGTLQVNNLGHERMNKIKKDSFLSVSHMCFITHCVLESLDAVFVISTCWEDRKVAVEKISIKMLILLILSRVATLFSPEVLT